MEIVFRGTVLGVHDGEYTDQESGVTSFKPTVGIQSFIKTKYGNLEPVTSDVKLSSNQIKNGLDSHYISLVGSQIEVSGSTVPWSYNGKVGQVRYFQGDGIPMVLAGSSKDSDIPLRKTGQVVTPSAVKKAS